MNHCLACNNTNLHLLLDLGFQPLANNYGRQNDEKYPLMLYYCSDCYHAQLGISIDPELLYRDYYYVSGTSNTLREWFADFADRFDTPGSIIDVASNDGSLLLEFQKKNWNVLGVDPAENLDTQGIKTDHVFFDEDYEASNKVDVITAFNVLAHGPNPLSLMKGIYNNLKDDGVAYVMTSQGSMFENGQIDTIYHEHHSFFSLKSFQTLANRAGFTDIEYTVEPIHGGSYLFKLTKGNKVTELSQDKPDFDGFADKAKQLKPYKLVGYGAAAKGVVMINYLKQDLAYVVDEAPLKIGKNIPGTTIPIVAPQQLADDPADLVIIVYCWNFLEEVTGKIKDLRPGRNDIIISYWK